MPTFAVIGAGGWGTAVAVLLAKKPGNAVRLFARPPAAAALREDAENRRLLPGVPFPQTLTVVTDPAECVAEADCVAVGVPTAFLRQALAPFAGHVPHVPVVSLTKGIENGSFARPTEILADVLRSRLNLTLSGPSHAEEVARGLPTSVVVAGPADAAAWVQRQFGTDRFRVYTNQDVLGVELAGALKNVIGLAAGVCDGLGFGDNAKAALVTRGLAEMTRFGVALGAKAETFAGLAGTGDLITTCFSRHGRNRRVGERLAKGESLGAVLAGPQVAEGVNTAKSVHELAAARGLELPVTAAVYRTLYGGHSPADAVRELMGRELKTESPFGG